MTAHDLSVSTLWAVPNSPTVRPKALKTTKCASGWIVDHRMVSWPKRLDLNQPQGDRNRLVHSL